IADGVVVGSALVNVIKDHVDNRAQIGGAMTKKISDLIVGVNRTPA
ncbi:MAG: tryptophan synthase subunit alpha, partial [Opitutaceae bacterium]|nr:tryptophan synthase subunit alpha [Opitutaceae bacterium]